MVQRMQEKHGWEICYWTASRSREKQIKDKFPDVVFHAQNEAMRGIAPEKHRNLKLQCLDKDILESLSYCESIVLKMMDRMAATDAFSYHERLRHYHRLLSYWNTILDITKPDIIVWPTSPHMVYDYIIYELCKIKNIKTLMFVRTSIPGLVYPVSKFEQGSDKIYYTYKQKLLENYETSTYLSPSTLDYVQKVSGPYSRGIPYHVKFKRMHKARGFSIARSAFQIFYGGMPQNYEKLAGRRVEELHESRLEFWLNLIKAHRTRKDLAKYYDHLVRDVDLTKPFIFVALQCQPERSTSPDGEVFVHQNIMIEMLGKSVPEGWYVYVKEHISQFKNFQRAERSRSKNYYDDISGLPNVRLVPLSVSSFELIDSARAVGVVTGTVGFEAVIRGTPVLVTGHPWYKGCEGVFHTPTNESCKKALSAIESGYTVNKEKVKLFLHVIEEVGITAYTDPAYSQYLNISSRENALAISKSIAESIYEQL